MATLKPPAGQPGVPLLLRRRRDGSLALVNRDGAIGAADRAFPSTHLFGYRWLATDGAAVATVNGDKLVVELVNARATYSVTARTDAGLECSLVATDLFEAPAITEEA